MNNAKTEIKISFFNMLSPSVIADDHAKYGECAGTAYGPAY
jgi:hypothetical protein